MSSEPKAYHPVRVTRSLYYPCDTLEVRKAALASVLTRAASDLRLNELIEATTLFLEGLCHTLHKWPSPLFGGFTDSWRHFG